MKHVILNTRAKIVGFAPRPDGSFDLTLDFKEGSIIIPVTKPAIESIGPAYGKELVFEISIPAETPVTPVEPDAPTQ